MTIAVVIGFWLVPAAVGHSQVSPNQPPPGERDVTFFNVAELSYDQASVPSLVGSQPADPKEWPATFYAMSTTGACTSTLVGATVLLTAAHCVPKDSEITISKSGKKYKATCTHESDFPSINITADWALCLLTTGEITGIAYERINSDPSKLRIFQQIMLTGFGYAANGGNDGVFRTGETNIVALPAGTINYIVTKGPAVVSYGDSGGAAYIVSAGNTKDRLQVSVNSQGTHQDESLLASTSTDKALSFFRRWADDHTVRICGLHEDAKGCR